MTLSEKALTQLINSDLAKAWASALDLFDFRNGLKGFI